VRRVLVALMVAAVGLVLAASAVDARESLSASNRRRTRGQTVTYFGTTSCSSVYLSSRPRRGRAIHPQTKTVHGDSFSFRRRVLSTAAFGTHQVVARCGSANGKVIGRRQLIVGRLSHTGALVLPQLLLGVGLVGVGAILLMVGRRRPFSTARARARGGIHIYAQ
jgi:hypothetical protein